MPRYDAYIQVIPATKYTGMKFISFGQKRSLAVCGLQKLVGEYIVALLTPTGTDPLDLGRGTDLPNLIGSNIDVSDAHDILVMSVDKAAKDIASYQSGRPVPSDERIASASVTGFISIPEAPGFAAQVYIVNVANQGLTFLLPTLEVRAS